MISETGEFMDDKNDAEELSEIRERNDVDRIVEAAKKIAGTVLEMPCLECNGAKLVDYKIIKFLQPPWYLRILGFKPIPKESTQSGVPCRRCDGTGKEKISPVD